ncbi:uncharacterized protein PAC_04110 [Phialocephala subalpina]|uniref:Uncharacterized protein n=1 Tax=Phialocephala subalpina TaxID=576137 RepID=A0A1L7WN84_9HELO|nr:uncharacterized protein PAC_04110 [Phialocephala subalpina]
MDPWRALSILAPIVSGHDDDGLDLYFMNHKLADPGASSKGTARWNPYWYQDAQYPEAIFGEAGGGDGGWKGDEAS